VDVGTQAPQARQVVDVAVGVPVVVVSGDRRLAHGRLREKRQPLGHSVITVEEVEPTGFEPVTFWLPARRSPS
jgi:hypothetical protein